MDGRQPRGEHLPVRQGHTHRETSVHRVGLDILWKSPAAKQWLFAAALVAAVCLAYRPAWRGGFIWDDDRHVTRPELRSWDGLYRIWFDPGATQQYYPLLHSAFWFQCQLWDDATLGYHLVTILQHAVSALLVALILHRLAVPGAFLAAAIFALHPVHVESVAWISEQKNTLSAVFYLGATLLYLNFDETRNRRMYALALVLFVLGLLSKTVTATLPAALLVIFWWQRGRLSWRRDVLPLLPYFILGATAGISTAWVERKLIGAEGMEFELTLMERGLQGGRAVWFYLGKLMWPMNLKFIYPRWEISQKTWWQYLYPAAAIALLGLFWWLRGRWRGPLAGLLFFVGTLFPVLGFFNVYPFIFSYVADHFQYLASLGIIVLTSAGIAILLKHCEQWHRPAGYAVCAVLLVTLGCLTWRQSRMYTDIETLYQTAIDGNATCWMAHNNLGMILANRGQVEEAIIHYQRALEIKPDYAEAHNNLGMILANRGQVEEAIIHYQRSLKIKPDYAMAYNNFGLALANRGRFDEAVDQYRKALKIEPNFVMAYNNLGAVLASRGRFKEAVDQYCKALKIEPNCAQSHNNLGAVLANCGQFYEALAHFRSAVKITPNYANAHYNLGLLLTRQGDIDQAMAHYQRALEIKPDYTMAYNNLGLALASRGRFDEALAHFRKALEINPDCVEAQNNLARVLARPGSRSAKQGGN